MLRAAFDDDRLQHQQWCLLLSSVMITSHYITKHNNNNRTHSSIVVYTTLIAGVHQFYMQHWSPNNIINLLSKSYVINENNELKKIKRPTIDERSRHRNVAAQCSHTKHIIVVHPSAFGVILFLQLSELAKLAADWTNWLDIFWRRRLIIRFGLIDSSPCPPCMNVFVIFLFFFSFQYILFSCLSLLIGSYLSVLFAWPFTATWWFTTLLLNDFYGVHRWNKPVIIDA